MLAATTNSVNALSPNHQQGSVEEMYDGLSLTQTNTQPEHMSMYVMLRCDVFLRFAF